MRRRMVPRCKVWLLGFGRLRASGRAAAASACRGCAVVAVKYAWWARTCARIALHSSQGRPCKGVQLAACKTLALAKRPRSGFWHRRAAPERPDHTQDDPHALRRLRHRAWAILGQEMRPLQHALLWRRVPGAALERRRPRPALQKAAKKAGGAEQYARQ